MDALELQRDGGIKMNMKRYNLFLLVFLVILLGSVGLVSAVECNADLSQGGNSCTVSSSLGGCYEI